MPARRYDAERRGYSPRLARKICREIALGRSLKSICQDKGMPCLRTAHRWLAANAEFQSLYASAHDLQLHFYLDEILEIADNAGKDAIDESRRALRDSIARTELRIGTRKWMCAIRKPVKYGSWHTRTDSHLPAIRVVRQIVVPERKKERKADRE